MEQYMKSGNIQVFPLSKNRESLTYNSRALREDNIANIIRQLLDTDISGFVISDSITMNNSRLSNPFTFNLYGYFIQVNADTSISDLTSGASEVWASLSVGDNGEIIGQDVNSEYQGVVFTASEPTDASCTAKLKILEKVGNDWQIPVNSKIKFKSESLNIERIDGKH